MDIKEIAKYPTDVWYIEHIDACPLFAEASAYGFTMPFPKFASHYKFTLGYYYNEEFDWATLIEDIDYIGNEIIKANEKNPLFFKRLYGSWAKRFRRFYAHRSKIRKQELGKLSNSELAGLWSRYYKELIDIRFQGFIDSFMFFADRHFLKIVEDFCSKNNVPDANKVYTILSAPIKRSFLSEKDEELGKISKINDEKRKRREIERYFDRFFWIKGSYAGPGVYGYDEVIAELDKSAEKGKGNAVLAHIQNKKDKDKLMKRYRFSKEIVLLTRLIETFSKWQDDRKIYTLFHVAVDGIFMREASKRLNIDFNILKYTYSGELAKALKGEIDRKKLENDLKERRRCSLWVYTEGRIDKIITGEEAKKVFDSIQHKHSGNEMKEIKGMTASLGRAKGPVIIIKSIKDIERVRKGDILVTSMTRPEHTPALEKVKAIVTDDGGITSHAAIVSRELKIPCVIGTKIATKVLKDGDVVEVDADKGVVRKIK